MVQQYEKRDSCLYHDRYGDPGSHGHSSGAGHYVFPGRPFRTEFGAPPAVPLSHLYFDDPNFEVDENGHPYWVVPRIEYTIGLYGGTDITGVVLCDAVTGESQYYPIGEVPQWVDRAVSPDILIEQFDNWGTLKHGFLNSIFGQKDSLVSTEGYNYLALNDDIGCTAVYPV